MANKVIELESQLKKDVNELQEQHFQHSPFWVYILREFSNWAFS